MEIGKAGLDLIKSFEGLSLKAYNQGGKDVPTIGYGHTRGVKMGDVITEHQAEEFLRQDVASAEHDVNRLVKVPLTQNQFDALVSFTFNLGGGNLSTSTLLKKLNVGNYEGAAEEFPRWSFSRGVHLAGLERRRKAEQQLFLRRY